MLGPVAPPARTVDRLHSALQHTKLGARFRSPQTARTALLIPSTSEPGVCSSTHSSLGDQRQAVVLVGAQAVYFRVG